MFCSKCGEQLNENMEFCPKCGDKITRNVSVEVQQQTPVKESLPGEGYLRTTGIIGIIFSASSLFYIPIGFLLIDWLDGWWRPSGAISSWGTYFTLALIVVSFDMFVSIMGVVNCRNLKKAAMLETIGTIYIIVAIVWSIIDVNTFGPIMLIFLPLYLIVPIYYRVGATKNRKAFDKEIE